MAVGYRNIKGLLETIEAQRPADATPGEVAQKTAVSLYPRTISHLDSLQTATGVATRSQLVRLIIDFAGSHQQEFAEFLADAAELKVG